MIFITEQSPRPGFCVRLRSAASVSLSSRGVGWDFSGDRRALADRIFINYRRAESIGTAGRLRDRLAQSFGQQNIFMDVDSIPAGVDFVADLNSQVAACSVFLAVIGPNWLDAKDESGARRLDNPDDFVTIEIAAALARDIREIFCHPCFSR